MGAIFGGGVALALPRRRRRRWCCRRCSSPARWAAWLWAAIPAFLRTRFNANEILVSLMLVYVATLIAVAAGARPVARSRGLQLSAVEDVRPTRRCCRSCSPETRLNVGFLIALAAVAAGWRVHAQEPRRLPDARRGARRPPPRNYAGISAHAHDLARHADRRRLRRPRRRRRSRGADRPAAAVDLAGLRLRRDHRRLRRPAASGRHRVREPADVAALPRRRVGADEARRCRRRSPGCSRARCCSSCSPPTCSSTTGCASCARRRAARRPR